MIFTPATLAAHLLGVVVTIHDEEEKGLKEAAELVVEEAKSSLGTYQGAVGTVPAWAPLSPATQADRVSRGYPADEPLLRTGELRDSIDYEVEDGHAYVGSDDESAPFHEFGTVDMPQRSFLAGAAYRLEDEIAEIIGEAIFKAIK